MSKIIKMVGETSMGKCNP